MLEWKRLLDTSSSLGPVFARIGLGLVMLPHGLQKAFGWFGGYGFSGTMDFFTDTLGIPWLLGLAAVLAESLGALLLIAGGLTRPSALAIGITMLVAMFTSHVSHGFFMNWGGNQAGEGIEFFLLTVGLAGSLLVTGGGRFSIDRALATRSPSKVAPVPTFST